MNVQTPKTKDGVKASNEMVKIHKKNKALKIIAVLCAIMAAAWLCFNLFFRLPSGDTALDESAPLSGFDKFDILLMGIDGREEIDIGDRTDTIILVTLDTQKMKARMLTIPRDTRIQYHDKWMKINGVYGLDGPQGTCNAVEALLGTKVDRYAVVDFNGVIELVNLMGGIDVDVPKRMYKPLEKIDLQPGMQHLDGLQALGYMRYRDASLSDFDRSERQKQVIVQLAERMMHPENLLKLSEITGTAMKYLDTNLSNHEIISIAKQGKTLLDHGVDSILLPGAGKTIHGGWYYIADLDQLEKAEREARQIETETDRDEGGAGKKPSEPQTKEEGTSQSTEGPAAESPGTEAAPAEGLETPDGTAGETDPDATVIVPGTDITGEYTEASQEGEETEPAPGDDPVLPDEPSETEEETGNPSGDSTDDGPADSMEPEDEAGS